MDATPSRRPSRMPTVLAALFCLCAAMQVYRTGATRDAIDLYQHWAVVHAVREHLVPNVYSDEGRRALGRVFAERANRAGASQLEKQALSMNLDLYSGKLETVGTPALYAAVSPFVSDDYEIDRRTFLIAQIAAVMGACLVFAAAIGQPAWVGLLLAAWAVWFFEPVISDLVVGNVSSFQWLWLGLVVLASRAERGPWRDGLVGGALGLAAAMKPNLLLIVAVVLLPLAVDRRTGALLRTTAGVAAGAMACFLGSSFWFGTSSAWTEWARGISRLTSAKADIDQGNMGVVSALYEVTHRDFSRPLLVTFALVCVVALFRSKRAEEGRSQDDVLFAVAVGGTMTALAAPIFWLHYGVLVAPAAFVSWRHAPANLQWSILPPLFLLSSIPRTLDGDLPRFAIGVALAQIALFALALLAWTRARGPRADEAKG